MSMIMRYTVEQRTSKGWEVVTEPFAYHEGIRLWSELLSDGVECRLTASAVSEVVSRRTNEMEDSSPSPVSH